MELFQDGRELLSPVWTHLTEARITKGEGRIIMNTLILLRVLV